MALFSRSLWGRYSPFKTVKTTGENRPGQGPERDSGGRFVRGSSGNRAGRRKGAPNKVTRTARELIEERTPEIIEAIIEKALAGDPSAQRALLDRIVPRSSADQHVDLVGQPEGEIETATDLIEDLIRRVASGRLTPDQGQRIGALIAHLRESMVLDDLQSQVQGIREELENATTRRD